MDISLKSLIQEGKSALLEEGVKEKKKKERAIPHIEIALENDSDFVLKRTTSTTSKMLVCILSQGLIYLKDEKKGEIEHLTNHHSLENFLSGTDYGYISFSQLKYRPWESGYGTPHISNFMYYALKHKDEVKELVNKKIFFKNLGDKNVAAILNDIGKTPNGYALLQYAFELRDLLKLNYYADDYVVNIYYLLIKLQNIGITKEKLQYNSRFFENNMNWFYYQCCQGSYRVPFINIIKQNNLELNRFFEYVDYLMNKEGLQQDDYNWSNKNFTISNYQDYLNMQSEMYGKVREKYPINWLTEERKLVNTYNAWKKLHKEEIMLHMCEKIQHLSYSDKEYTIVIPKSSNDIVDEGAGLGHCVGSYVDRIISGETNIVFMRNVKTPEESLVTVEVRDNEVYQYKGRADRNCTDKEMQFLLKWGKANNLNTERLEMDLGDK